MDPVFRVSCRHPPLEALLQVLLVLHPSDSSTIPFVPVLVSEQFAVALILQVLLRLKQELEVEAVVLVVVP